MYPEIRVTIGVSKSGKSTYCEKQEDFVHVSSDNIRDELFNGEYNPKQNNEVFEEMFNRTFEFMKNGQDVIYDATNLSYKKRKHMLKRLTSSLSKYGINKISIVYIMFFADIDLLYSRAQKDDFPQEVIVNQMKQFQIPSELDLFKSQHLVNLVGFYDGGFRGGYLNPLSFIYKFNQNNPHHDYTLDMHSLKLEAGILYPELSGYGIWHDIGKVITKRVNDDGTFSFPNHANVSTYLYLGERTREQGYISSEALFLAGLIQEHMNYKFIRSDKALSKLIERSGENPDWAHETKDFYFRYLNKLDVFAQKK